jgi:hypothetical protein
MENVALDFIKCTIVNIKLDNIKWTVLTRECFLYTVLSTYIN